MTRFYALALCLMLLTHASCHSSARNCTSPTSQSNEPVSTTSVEQLQEDFLDLEFGMFIHYNMATYKKTQWAKGYPSPEEFAPATESVDTDAWAKAAKSAGMTYAVLTVKHVSGFCLWDSKFTTYDIMHPDCPYKQDLVQQFIDSFTRQGLKVGLYYCWRSPGFADEYKVLPPECDPATHSFEEQIEYQKKQIVELVEKYPEVFYIWNDGLDSTIMPASQAKAFFRAMDREILASGNWWDWDKKGTPFVDIAVQELKLISKDNTYPSETCWTLEQEWFWRDDFEPKPAETVVEVLQQTNNRNSNLLLNVAPNRKGNFSDESIQTLVEIGRLRDVTSN